MSRNPWLSGEWQLQLASDEPQTSRALSIPCKFSAIHRRAELVSNGDTAATSIAPPSQAAASRDDEDGEQGSKAQVDPITLAKMSVISGTALLQRNHLKQLYGLSEARCAKFNPTKKQSAGADNQPRCERCLTLCRQRST